MIKIKNQERDSSIPSSSMADIAFLLLVFFLLITTIDIQKGLDNRLPEKDVPIKVPDENLTNIFIRNDGAILLENERTELNEIASIVKKKIEDNKDMIFSLKTQKYTKYKIFVQVLDQIKLAGAKKISIADTDE